MDEQVSGNPGVSEYVGWVGEALSQSLVTHSFPGTRDQLFPGEQTKTVWGQLPAPGALKEALRETTAQ